MCRSRSFGTERAKLYPNLDPAAIFSIEAVADLAANGTEIKRQYALIERLDDRHLSACLMAFNPEGAIGPYRQIGQCAGRVPHPARQNIAGCGRTGRCAHATFLSPRVSVDPCIDRPAGKNKLRAGLSSK